MLFHRELSKRLLLAGAAVLAMLALEAVAQTPQIPRGRNDISPIEVCNGGYEPRTVWIIETRGQHLRHSSEAMVMRAGECRVVWSEVRTAGAEYYILAKPEFAHYLGMPDFARWFCVTHQDEKAIKVVGGVCDRSQMQLAHHLPPYPLSGKVVLGPTSAEAAKHAPPVMAPQPTPPSERPAISAQPAPSSEPPRTRGPDPGPAPKREIRPFPREAAPNVPLEPGCTALECDINFTTCTNGCGNTYPSKNASWQQCTAQCVSNKAACFQWACRKR